MMPAKANEKEKEHMNWKNIRREGNVESDWWWWRSQAANRTWR